MLLNFLMLLIGAVCGIMCLSCLVVNSIEEGKASAHQRGLERGRQLGILEEKGRKNEKSVTIKRYQNALYRACADLISVNYPRKGENVQELVNKYLYDDEQ